MSTEHEPETRDIEILEMSAAQARRRFRRLMVLVQQNTVVIVTRVGKPAVYMLPVWLYESWMTALRSASEGESSQDTEALESQG